MRRADQRKYHYIYKTMRYDGKYYIGLHSTDDLDDGYLGSGSYLLRSIKKHGKDKHAKIVLEFLPSRVDVKAREKMIVCKELLNDPMCMNCQLGGGGGELKESSLKKTSLSVKKLWNDPVYRAKVVASSGTRWNDPEYRISMSTKMKKVANTAEAKQAQSDRSKKLWGNEQQRKIMLIKLTSTHEQNSKRWQDPAYKEEMSKRLACINKARWVDPMWINKSGKTKKIERSTLTEHLAQGFSIGRS